MKINGISVSLSLSINQTSISTLLSWSTSPYLCHPPQSCSVHFGIQAFRWPIAVKVTLRGGNVMLGIGCQLHQPSFDVDDVLTLVFDRVLVIFIPSHIIMSVLFTLLESLIIWYTSQELLHAITIVDACKMPSGGFILEHIVIVRLYALRLHPTLDIFVLVTHCERVVLATYPGNPPAGVTEAWSSNLSSHL